MEDFNMVPPHAFLAMTNPSFNILPDVFSFEHPQVAVTHCLEDQLENALPAFEKSIEEGVIGLAPVYNDKCRLTTLAMASDTQVLIITLCAETSLPFKGNSKKNRPELPKHRELLHAFLCDATITKFAFLMDRLVAGLFLDHNLRIVRAKDLLSASARQRHSQAAYYDALGGYPCLKVAGVKKMFEHEETQVNEPRVTALQAWAAYTTACFEDMQSIHAKIPPIDTLNLDTQVLCIVARTIRNICCRIAMKPTRVRNDVQAKYNTDSKKLVVTSERYKTRVLRPSGSQVYNIMADKADGSQKEYRGRAVNVSGRTSVFDVSGDITTTVIRGVETIGREKPTAAESTKERYMLDMLQGRIDLSASQFIMSLWFASPKPKPVKAKSKSKSQKQLTTPVWVGAPSPPPPPPIIYPGRLNESQEDAINKILTDDIADRLVLIQGPPGTGKTTVISAAVNSIIASSRKNATVWLVAYSNVAVKNMAEKLASVGFQDFKILVSKDFHFDWHEHLYEKIEANLIRSDELVEDAVATERQLQGSRVVICTLSILSNDMTSTITRQVPLRLQTVIFDEASQIEMGDYIPMLLRHHSSLRKLVFIGDDKQLAPHGSSEVKSLQSVFEKLHLKDQALFLDTQYRMPTPLGDFVSSRVYRNKLKSVHSITDPESCRFVDVADGLEESKGSSWQNSREVAVAIAVARQLTAAGKSFRVITPYDPQRSLLERGLKEANLPWKDKCFNVDAFQGNEDDYIIISLVRTAKLGFLFDRRRANVMLTRCKKGLIICTQRKFVEGPAEGSLIGELCKSFEEPPWVGGKDVQENKVQPFL